MAAAHQPPARAHHSPAGSPAHAQRLRAGITIETLCDRTKIGRQYLEAIEARSYTRLPGGVFDVNYIRQYAEAIGYPPQTLLADYRRELSLLMPVPAPPAPRTPPLLPIRSRTWLRLASRRVQRWLALAPARSAS